VFFTRLGQRVIHILNTFTASGQLYEIDMRLRPAGNSGMLVSTIAAFEQYQLKDAWTWEHQALVRARVVCGSGQLEQAFNKVRSHVLQIEREADELKTQVRKMREKMRDHLGSKDHGKQFNIKQDPGGVVDIEFIVQYLCLKHARQFPEIIQFTDNIRILQSLGRVGVLSDEECGKLMDAYIVYRSTGHRQSMQELASTLVEADNVQQSRAVVISVWDKCFNG